VTHPGGAGRRWLLALASLLAPGCGGDGGAVAVEAACRALEEGQARLAEGRAAEARDAFQAAIRAGGLQPDFYCEAVALLGRCEATLGNREAAAEALAILELGDADQRRVSTLRALVEPTTPAGGGNQSR